MKARYVNELTEGARVDAAFVLRSKELRIARNGDPYLWLELADRSGAIAGVIFRPVPESTVIPAGTVVQVEGTVTSFRGRRRISADSLVPARTWNPADLLAPGPHPLVELEARFRRIGASVSAQGPRALLRRVFGDKEFYARFRQCPGSHAAHHAYLNGLLEHTVAVAEACIDLAERYEGVDRDLLVTAALLHDIGRADELSFDTGVGYTEQGRLLGHIALGTQRMRDAARRSGLDAAHLMRLEHAMLTYQAEPTAGVTHPSTFEAVLLHLADGVDVQAAAFLESTGGASRAEEGWTNCDNPFGRSLYAPPSIGRPSGGATEDARHIRLTA